MRGRWCAAADRPLRSPRRLHDDGLGGGVADIEVEFALRRTPIDGVMTIRELAGQCRVAASQRFASAVTR